MEISDRGYKINDLFQMNCTASPSIFTHHLGDNQHHNTNSHVLFITH